MHAMSVEKTDSGNEKRRTPTYGTEIEKTFAKQDGDSHAVGETYFDTLMEIKQSRGEKPTKNQIEGKTVGVTTPHGEEGLDNAFNLGESATGPISESEGGLQRLHEVITQELRDVSEALAAEGATVINMANHPLVEITEDVYKRTVVPKLYYRYLNEFRGWNHEFGIDAAAQNSPSTGVEIGNAVDAVNTTLAAGSALIALYANSPFKGGEVTGLKENRLTIWEKMFQRTNEGDRRLSQMPKRPFADMRDYFQWMFAPDTEMFFALDAPDPKSAKTASRIVTIQGRPSLLEFLSKPEWEGTVYGGDEKVVVVPRMEHLELHQYTQFAGARIRFALEKDGISVQDFISAMQGKDDEIEQLFEGHTKYFYIEGRDPGANFPDKSIRDLPNGELLARSVTISPSAIQAGLIRNHGGMERIFRKYSWSDLRGLREASIKNGLQGEYNGIKVKDFTDDIFDVAIEGVKPEEQWMLAYPAFVLSSERNGADRALEVFENLKQGTVAQRIREVVRTRAIAV